MTDITHEALEALSKAVEQSGPLTASALVDLLGGDRRETQRLVQAAIDRGVLTVGAGLKVERRTGQLMHAVPSVTRKFNLGDRVTKTKGSSWTGLVVGFYSTSLTPIGYAVESENEPGSVQIYPESALEACLKARENSDG